MLCITNYFVGTGAVLRLSRTAGRTRTATNEFYRNSRTFLIHVVDKLLDRSPLCCFVSKEVGRQSNSLVRGLSSLSPSVMKLSAKHSCGRFAICVDQLASN